MICLFSSARCGWRVGRSRSCGVASTRPEFCRLGRNCRVVCSSTLPCGLTTHLNSLLGGRNRVGGIVGHLAADRFHRNFHRQKLNRTKECRERSVRRIATCSDANQTRLRRETRRIENIPASVQISLTPGNPAVRARTRNPSQIAPGSPPLGKKQSRDEQNRGRRQRARSRYRKRK